MIGIGNAATTVTFPPPHPPVLLVTLHFPLDMHAVAMILKAIAKAYPAAVVKDGGEVWDRP